jgi:hypothetical protein
MWEPRRLTTLWASTACYRDSFTFFYHWNYNNRRQEATLTDPHKMKLSLYLINKAQLHEDLIRLNSMKTWERKYSSTIFYLGTRGRWVISFTPLPLHPRRKSYRTNWTRSCVGPIAGMDAVGRWCTDWAAGRISRLAICKQWVQRSIGALRVCYHKFTHRHY